ncbi:MAG: hypothetical protein ACSLFR_12340 [Solirubrobacteraceae bacterium]
MRHLRRGDGRVAAGLLALERSADALREDFAVGPHTEGTAFAVWTPVPIDRT